MSSLFESVRDARAKMVAGEFSAAFLALRETVTYPAKELEEEAAFREPFDVFASIAKGIAGDELSNLVRRASRDPNDVKALYDAGYALYEQKLFGIAATLFHRANKLAPGNAGIVSELCASLEGMMLYGIAAITVDVSELYRTQPMFAYLSAYNWLMAGSLDLARERFTLLPEASDDKTIVHLRRVLSEMLTRAHTLERASVKLGEHSLTAWHAIINGSLLLHESPHGYDTPMRGRYAYVSDSAELMREGLDRLKAVLGARPAMPRHIVSAPDPASRMLALAASRVLNLPCSVWTPSTLPQNTLVVAWNMDTVGDAAFLQALQSRAVGQVLFAHVSQWTEPFPYAPDVTTYLAQTVTHPYLGGALRVDEQTGKAIPSAPDTRDENALADEIVNATTTRDPSVSPLELVLSIDRALLAEPSVYAKAEGARTRQRAGSPVASSRFT